MSTLNREGSELTVCEEHSKNEITRPWLFGGGSSVPGFSRVLGQPVFGASEVLFQQNSKGKEDGVFHDTLFP